MTLIAPLLTALWSFGSITGASANAPVTLNGSEIPYEIWHETVMPGEDVQFTHPANVSVYIGDEPAGSSGSFEAPETAGTYDLEFRKPDGTVVHDIALFVLEPATHIAEDGRLNGFRMGAYPQDTPRGFIRLDKGHGDVKVSPSFRIGQFLCHQQPDHWPKYLLVSSSNLNRLEILLNSLRADGLTEADTFFVMSGFRSPFYNTSIGSAKLSRHMYGDATDVYLDVAPKDGVMDDINRDGVINKEDANFLYDYAEDLFATSDAAPKGGLGSYSANAVHGPFVHVDGRGRAARWGR
ncbi:D-Ala-D-Ala carboxypeptidase family metallohydrolase [Henriciella sp.]|uniref:D-Ala-D-Ala carboxypeptidase family metallohydrolase n=1 Tax=Henriciella sp. TaxID=1968823 RepID=UPI00262708BB|nr:D-Ala-D-Ala carboxypeptidase family metallohydrolase [Henriciella sp.]